ncbi:MAG: alanine--tRNA ligase [Erysipelotrichaceae bacterium]|jgi:alanyl-tRNA synthetase|nr:alanine--tRNA ligase [Erysipelotrichaceae bacterium]
MRYMKANDIRRMWLDFFASKGHHIETGASLIPKNDPTLLWINAGVAALKKYFDGSEIPPCRRITNAQKCIRTNDIENVGRTARHHTFFEMLGNFSIGDYFRNEVIAWAVELLTDEKWFAFPKDKLYMTYHPHDLDTKKRWIECGISEDHLIPKEDNFWEIGEGPCGPDTEIFFDRGEKYDVEGIGLKLLFEDLENDRYIEIWNIVFSQFNSVAGVKREDYKELPSKNIDTGAGLERFACVLQGTDTNFETDLFYPFIKEVEKYTGKKYSDNSMPFRVIADHLRAITFALADGESFSNEGRGYVLRRLLRRAVRFCKVLGIEKPYLYTLIPLVAKNMEDYYPYLISKQDYVARMVKTEEEKFIKTLNNGENLLMKLIEENHAITGADVFKLYDTFGFPKELTVEICHEQGIQVDLKVFEQLMEEQRQRAREARVDLQSMNRQAIDLMNCQLPSTFTYSSKQVETKVIALFKDGKKVDAIDDEGEIMLEVTNFYAESGGQTADSGTLENDNMSAKVTNVIKAPNKQHLHYLKVMYGEIKVGDIVTAKVDEYRHALIERNHSSLHLLQQALIEVLGEHINQQGSYLNEEYSHFDFNHYGKMSHEQIAEVERKVNHFIALGLKRDTLILPLEEAKKLGAKALFDDKYDDTVRVVTFGDVSKEFCGGTHVKNTADIGLFVIEYEESIAAGVRRIQARTSIGAYELLKKRENLLNQSRDLLGLGSIGDVPNKLKTLTSEKETLRKENEELKAKLAQAISDELKNSFVEKNGLQVLVKLVKDQKRDSLLKIIYGLRENKDNYLIALIGEENGGYPIVVSASPKANEKGFLAGKLVKEIAGLLGGSGGGKPDLASGAGKDISRLQEVKDLLLK